MEQVDSSNHKFTKIETEVKTGVAMTEIITISKAIRTGIGQIMVIEDSIDKIEVDLDMNKITEEEMLEETAGALTDRIVGENIETITEMTGMTEVGTGLDKGHFPEAIKTIGIGVHTIVGLGQDQEQVQIETEYNVISVGNMTIS